MTSCLSRPESAAAATSLSPSGPKKELPAADEEMPAQPQPQREQDPAAGSVPHDQPDGVAERRPPVVLMGQADPFPGEQRAEQQRPDQVPDLHGASVAERAPGCRRRPRSGYDLSSHGVPRPPRHLEPDVP